MTDFQTLKTQLFQICKAEHERGQTLEYESVLETALDILCRADFDEIAADEENRIPLRDFKLYARLASYDAEGELQVQMVEQAGEITFQTLLNEGDTPTPYSVNIDPHRIAIPATNEVYTALTGEQANPLISGNITAFICSKTRFLSSYIDNTELYQKNDIPSFSSKQPEKIDYPIDKVNLNVWNILGATPNGQLSLFATEKRGSKKEATVIYSINFDEVENEVSITKSLNAFDKRCYIAASALYAAGNETISAGQIYSAMGNNGRPSAADIEKINASLTKMGSARVYIDNMQEVTVNTKYPFFKYDAALLPFERCCAFINNQLCETAIHLFREPPLTTFARERKQVTTIPRALLASPLNKTNANLQLDDYLISRISHIKHGKMSNKILYKTVFENCGITEIKQKQRAPEKIRKYLEHYKKNGWIKGFKEGKDGVTISY